MLRKIRRKEREKCQFVTSAMVEIWVVGRDTVDGRVDLAVTWTGWDETALGMNRYISKTFLLRVDEIGSRTVHRWLSD